MYLRQSTAATVEVGQFVGTDGLTEKTALTSQTGRYILNGTSASLTPASWAHTANGNYAVGLSSTHTGSVGILKVVFTDSANYLQVERSFTVLSANVYDALFGSTALSTHTASAVAALVLATPANLLATDSNGRVQVQVGTSAGQINSSSGKVPATLASTDVTGNVAADLQTIKTQTVTCAAGVTVPSVLASTTNITAGTIAAVSGSVGSVAGNVSGSVASVVGNVGGSVASVSGNVGGSVASISGVTFPTNFGVLAITASTGKVTVGTNSDKAGYSISGTKTTLDALNDIAATAIVSNGAITTSSGAVSNVTTTATATNLTNLPAAPTDWLTAAGVKADAVTKIQSGLATASQIPANFTTATFASAGVFATAALANAPSGSGPSAATVAAAVWDLTTTGHTTAGTFGNAMNAAGSAGDPWSTSLPGAYSSGSAGYILGTNLNASITSRMATYTQPTGFLAATFPTTVASTTNITSASGITLAGVTHTGAVIPRVTLCDTTTTNTDMRGTDAAYTGTPPTVAAIRQEMDTNSTKLANLDAAVSTRSVFAGGAVASVTAPVTVGTSNDKTGYTLTSAYDAAKTAAQVGSAMTLDKTQALSAARDISAIADTSLTLNDALHCAIAAAAGKETVVGTAYTVKTPSTGTTLRIFTLDDADTPTSRT